MKVKFLTTLLVTVMLFPTLIKSQDKNTEDARWSQNPSTRVKVLYDYAPLPEAVNYVNPNTETRVTNTPIGSFLVEPNFRPFPHTATQSEIDATVMRGNPNIVWCAWNSYGPSFYGTGFAITTNGGTNWSGNYQTFTPNSGDPACWVWPTGSTWAGNQLRSNLGI